MKKAIVTGGAGFIGSWLCQKLRDEGMYVVAVDRKMPEFGFAPADEYHVFDLLNPVDFYDQLRFQDADEVYQLAAEMGGATYVFTGEHDADIVHHSATINLHVLEACRRWKVPKVFFASSACVYPSLDPVKIKFDHVDNTACREEDAGNPDSPYGAEKLFSETLYDAYARNHGIDVKIGRFHNVFGEYGTWRGGREKAPAALCRKIAETPHGGDIEIFGNGQQTRSFLHVSEAVEGVWRLMQSDFSGPVNIGSSEMISIDRLAFLIGEIAGKLFTITHVPGPLGVMGRNSDNSLIQEKLGWKPTATLREGLEKTYPWVAEQVEKAKALTPATL
jgi:GDP-D-mannose 3',5'-epimerase